MLSKFNNKKHRRLTALLLCVALMLGSVTSVSADISAADSETEVQNYAEEPTTEAVSYGAPEAQTEVQEGTPVAEETEAPTADTQQTEAHTEAATEAHTETAAETQAAETTETEVETETETEVVAQQLEYEDDQVKVHVTASEEGIIPDHASLKVVPLVKQEVTNEMTDEQKQEVEAINKKYDEAEKKLTEKAEKEAYDIAGFLAYDISLVDADGNKVEPNGDVKVTMDYKQPVIAEDAVQTVNDTEWLNSTKDLDVTVLHLEEDNKGKVTDVVDMTAEDTNGDAEINTTSENEIQKVTITTNSFSTFAIAYNSYRVNVQYVDQNGTEITSNQFTQNNVSIEKDKDLVIRDGDEVKIPETVTIDNKTYQYSVAHLDGVLGKNVYSVKFKDKKWRYKEKLGASNEDWNNGKGGTIYLVYQEQTQEQPTALSTVDTIEGQHEIAEANLTTSKTVKVTYYDKREYEITLGASTSGREAGTEAKAASVVLVLDRSGSMEDGMPALVNAADTFIDTLKDASPDSQIAVVYFNGTQGSNTDKTIAKNFTQLNTEENVTSIKNFLSTNQSPSDGTPMGDALKKAKSLLDADRTGNQQYVLFFTDGLPGYWETNNSSGENSRRNCMVANSAVNYANEIKAKATIYTVGYNLSGSGTLYWHQGDSDTSYADTEHGYYSGWWNDYYTNHELSTSASDFLKDYIATSVQEGSNKKYAYTVDKTEDLGKEFKKLAAQIGAYYSINAEKIVDVIDARFELTEAGRKALVDNAQATTNADGSKTYVQETRKDGTVVGTVRITENTDGTTTIEWTGTEAHIGNKDNLEDPAWERKIGVVAKADFIGGNAVTTNTGDSGVFVNENTTKMFPKPTVNVKALSLEMTGKSITVYKGDDLQPQAYYNQLAQTIEVVELDGTTKTLTGVEPVNKKQVSLPELTDDQKNKLENKKTLTIGDGDNPEYKYIYPGTSDAVGYFKYIYTIPETLGGNIHDHTAGNAASPAEKYNLEVVFVPYTVQERKNQNSEITVPASDDGGTVVSENLTKSADYIVNIIDGSIEITKVLETEPKGENGDTFTFTVTGPDNFSQDVSVTVTKASLENGKYTATYTGDELKHLARGEYTVTEKVAAGYDVKSIENDANATNTKYVLNNTEDIHFTMGTVVKDGEDVNVIKNYAYNPEGGGTLGKAIFTNEPVYSDWQIIKVSASSHDVRLAGAIFELQSTTDTNVKYYGKSGDAGIVEWYQKYQNNEVSDPVKGIIPEGTYTLKEIKAPTGYTLSNNTYTLQITKTGALKAVKVNGTELTPELQENGEYHILIENAVLYNLPNSGGSGIYWFSICGMLLMMAAAWIIYKNKCREVLVK